MGIEQQVFDELELSLLPLLQASAAERIAAYNSAIQAHDTMSRFMRAPLAKDGSRRRYEVGRTESTSNPSQCVSFRETQRSGKRRSEVARGRRRKHLRYRLVNANRLATATALLLSTATAAFLIRECPSTSHEPFERLVGPTPVLPAPEDRLIPTVNFSTAAGWPEGRTPHAEAGFVVTRYAGGLDHPRWLYVLPNFDVLVAEASTILREPKSLQERAQFSYQWRAGDMKTSANRITLLRAAAGAPTAGPQVPFLSDLHQPFGMALVDHKLYVADTDALLSFDYTVGTAPVEAAPHKVLELPAGGYNNHWTRNVIANRAGTKLYVSVGSGSDHGEGEVAQEERRADILELNPDGTEVRVFASGIRNPVGMAWGPGTETLWTVVNERDMLGNDLVPDYLTRVVPEGFYGWPYSYWGRHLDPRVRPQRPELVAGAIVPDYALGSHVAALGLVFYESDLFPSRYRGGAFIAEHGSWNRKPFVGYKVVFVPFRDGLPAGPPEDFLTGFMATDKPGMTYGRPVGLAVDGSGALLVADDVGNCVWRVDVTAAAQRTTTHR